MKLNLGCFNKQLPGFVNVDIREDVKPDVVDSAFALKKFENNSVEVVYASHMLEHLDYQETQQALSRWFDVLKVGGVLRLAVPDLEAVFAHYFYHQDLDVLMHMLYGSQRHDFDFHKNGWDYSRLRRDLLKVGFKDVKKWDWRTTEPHNYCDDYSQAYHPHMDKENGKLMSLNVEAIK
jgi:ubiquinone/menaquinone biosynthesis C-methylase UbiE